MERWLTADEVTYPVSFNGKVRFQLTVPADLDAQSVESQVLRMKKPRLISMEKPFARSSLSPGRIVNIVVG